VIVVGTGMGGASAGLALARAGRKVLFVERGPIVHSPAYEGAKPADAGWCPVRAHAYANFGEQRFKLPIGCVAGGSSAFYAAGLERFSPEDFEPRRNFPNVTDSTLPERWPVSYAELEPYYERAEELFRVRGTQDPLYTGGPSRLHAPPGLSERDQHLESSFKALGLHPYRSHVGCEFLEGCDGCLTGPCMRNCKRDAASTCLTPALERHDAKLLPECVAVRIEAGPDRVQSVVCRLGASEIRLQARTFVLAAGAFLTPALLLRSTNDDWPQGLANRSGLVGRNLMFHAGDFLAISPGTRVDRRGPKKTLALNDFYFTEGRKLGTFQTIGADLEVGHIIQYLRNTSESRGAWWRWLFSPTPVWWRKSWNLVMRAVGGTLFYLLRLRDAGLWVSIIEDLPYFENRVWPDPDSADDIIIKHDYSNELQERVKLFRTALRARLGRHRIVNLTPVRKIDHAHVCGTCRFGDDPESSVLDRNNRAHGIENLYVVDASFFPSSGGTNPSLTIVANALRVADAILERD